MVRVTVCFVAGILAAIHAGSFIGLYQLSLFIYLLIGFGLGLFARWRILTGFCGLALIFLFGYELVRERQIQECDLLAAGKITAYHVVVSRFAEERAKTWRTQGTLQAIRTSEGWVRSCGSLLVYFPKEGRVYQYGDVLLVRGTPFRIPPPANPGEFDFRRFMEFKGIYYQDFLKTDSVTWMRNDPPNSFLDRAIKVRQWADAKIKSVVHGEREQATATALVLGVTDGLDSELLQAYASTGALHVLAVSGLHVSIIYWILLLVLKPLDRTRPLKWLLAFISVFVLWSYAFVTGWSPSVLRAVTMFSFVAFSRPWRQSTNIYNTLASSMFCLLLYDPFFIMSVGFQLSYLAVFGIVFLQPRLYSLWEPRHRLVDEMWKVSSVSIAAQVATLPIALHYFHQFPNYFLPANLVVIPVSFVVLVLGLAITAFAFIDPLITVLGWLLTWSVKLMNYLVIIFERLPFSVIDGIYIDQWQAMVLGGLLASITLLFIQKNFFWLPLSLALAIFFSGLQWMHLRHDINASSIRIYGVSGHTLIEQTSDGNARLVSDTSVLQHWQIVVRYVGPSWIKAGVATDSALMYSNIVSRHGCSAWIWDDISFLQVTSKRHVLPTATVTFLVISNKSVESLTELSTVKFEKIIVDSSNSLYFAERLRNEAITLGIPLWSVPHEGAFEYKHAKR